MSQLAVDTLEAMFNKADADLDCLSRKLVFEVDCKQEEAGEGSDQMEASILLRRIAEVKTEFGTIVKEVEAIKEAEKEAVGFFRGELLNLCQLLENLQSKAGTQGDKPEELTRMETLLGVTDDRPSAAAINGPCGAPERLADTATPNGAAGVVSNGVASGAKGAGRNGSQTVKADANAVASDLLRVSASERRRGCDQIIEVDDEEFLSVSSLVRGRVKLADINQLYRVLWRHFKEEGNSEALTPSDMYKMGLRVTGQTGQAKLKVLKSIKLVDITKKGDVILL